MVRVHGVIFKSIEVALRRGIEIRNFRIDILQKSLFTASLEKL
jgi:hypothetical protein